MGERVRAKYADLSRAEHLRAIDSFEQGGEEYLQSIADRNYVKVTINLAAQSEDGDIPRGLSRLYKDAPHTICGLIAEIRRRDALIEQALTVMTAAHEDTDLMMDMREMITGKREA